MIINGKKIASEILEELKSQIQAHPQKRAPCLAFILVGDHPASKLYVKMKIEACKKIGMEPKGLYFDHDVKEQTLVELIESLNLDPVVDGILVQMPLPPHINAERIIEAISPQKDVDGFHPFNVGRLLLGYTPFFYPCTPLGIHELLKRSKIQVAHQHVVVMGRSNIVGKPIAAMLMQKNKDANATVTVVHSHTRNLEEITQSADILIAAMGSAHFVDAEMLKKDAVVIDVGINRIQGKLVGDVDFEKAKEVALHITPVPGGVGPMTIAMLLSNTLISFQARDALT